MYRTLISPAELLPRLGEPDWIVVDCRFYLQDTGRGREEYREAHIPGAFYAHLDEDLSGKVVPGLTGRHPLPDIDKLAQTLSRWGIQDGVQVVVYDDRAGGMAVRLWWLLQWLGHEAVALLEGGWADWRAMGMPVDNREPSFHQSHFEARPQWDWILSKEEVDQIRQLPDWKLVDARAPERYRGEVEPIDPVAGHIEGAINLFFMENVDAQGHFLPAQDLKQRYLSALGATPPEQTVYYCGSGVSACHDIFAHYHAGLGMPKLYPGSWSEWVAN